MNTNYFFHNFTASLKSRQFYYGGADVLHSVLILRIILRELFILFGRYECSMQMNETRLDYTLLFYSFKDLRPKYAYIYFKNFE